MLAAFLRQLFASGGRERRVLDLTDPLRIPLASQVKDRAMVTLQRFDDNQRVLYPIQVDIAAVGAVGHSIKMWGPKGAIPCRQVWLIGGAWFIVHDDGTLLDVLKKEALPDPEVIPLPEVIEPDPHEGEGPDDV